MCRWEQMDVEGRKKWLVWESCFPITKSRKSKWKHENEFCRLFFIVVRVSKEFHFPMIFISFFVGLGKTPEKGKWKIYIISILSSENGLLFHILRKHGKLLHFPILMTKSTSDIYTYSSSHFPSRFGIEKNKKCQAKKIFNGVNLNDEWIQFDVVNDDDDDDGAADLPFHLQ